MPKLHFAALVVAVLIAAALTVTAVAGFGPLRMDLLIPASLLLSALAYLVVRRR